MTSLTVTQASGLSGWLQRRRGLLATVALLVAFPFLVSIIVDGQGLGAVLANDDGNARFLQGLAIEIFILAIYALSYDLILGVTGLLSFGHAMFYAVGAYTFGIMLKTHEMYWVAALGVVLVAAVLQALLFGIVLSRVKGITFALVTLGMASVFWIVIQSSDLQQWAGAEIGLQGVKPPVWFLDTTNERFAFYLLAMALMILVYVAYQRMVESPAGKVFHAIRENEDRTLMLGYNTFWFKLLVLVVASITASLAGVLHTMHQPVVTPNVASLGFTVTALLVILIGGVGTITGALVGAAVYRLLQFYLDRWFGAASELLIGLAYVVLVLYLPYGIVGTWRVKGVRIRQGRARLLKLLSGGEKTSLKE
ncbi:MAG: branched-chain amino acid ABC transporter permease [Acidimicrobiia bacterium]|nr:branched-chain amino acid ABC transporter permease [Acidimicrobiia bacterium]MDX2466027.1 branched-chain amino acid ABC transporter permease [Acidimicrobiia bacterium]